MNKRIPACTGLLALSLAMMAGCATDPDRVEERREAYESDARFNEKIAQDWRNSGSEEMSAFYEQKAGTARHNSGAVGCDATSQFIFSIILGSGACEIK